MRKTFLLLPLTAVAFASSAGAASDPTISISPADVPFGQTLYVTGKHWPVIEFCSRTVHFSLRSDQNAFKIGKTKVKANGRFAFNYKVKRGVVGAGDWNLQAKQHCESGENGSPTPLRVAAPITIG